MVTVMLAENHEITRCGIRAVLYSESDIHILAECDDDSEVVGLVLQHAPDVLLLDVDEAGSTAFDVIRNLAGLEVKTRMLVLSEDEHEANVRKAFVAGASGYVLKRCSIQALSTAIRAVANGGCWIDCKLRSCMFGPLPGGVPDVEYASEPPPQQNNRRSNCILSPRETEILTLVAAGQTNVEIARALFISPETVKTHVRSIMDKLNVKDRTQAAIKGMQLGAYTV